MRKKAVVCGAGGFIGAHMVKRLKSENFWVRGVDLKYPEYSDTMADEFVTGDLRDPGVCKDVIDQEIDEVYQFAADMGGAGYIFVGENDADIMHNSATINLNVLDTCAKRNAGRVFYSSSACIYPLYNQVDPSNPKCTEDSAYPAEPDSEYGWEKLFSERLYLAFGRNKSMQVRVARYHNIFGPEGAWNNGREKAPAALCRKVAMAEDTGQIEVWGDGEQTRSFLFVEDCIEATLRLMRSDWTGPANIGSEEMLTINGLAEIIMDIAGKNLEIKHVDGPLGVRGRTSDNRLYEEMIGWRINGSLRKGLEDTYSWIAGQIDSNAA